METSACIASAPFLSVLWKKNTKKKWNKTEYKAIPEIYQMKVPECAAQNENLI